MSGESPTARRVAQNTAVQVAGRAAVLALGAASIIILTRYLGSSDYGKLGLAFAYLQIFAVVADAGMFTAVVRELARAPQRAQELIATTLALRLAFSLAMIVVAALISLALPYTPQVRVAIVIAGAAQLFGLLNSAVVALFQSQLRMERSVIADVAGRSASVAAAGAVALADLGFYAVMATAALGTLVQLLVTIRLAGRSISVRPRFERTLARGLLTASLPLGVALAVNELYFRFDTFVISLYEPYRQVGLYSLAYRVLEMAVSFPGVFFGSVFAVLSGYLAASDARVNATIQLAFDALVLVALPLAAGGLVVSHDIVVLAGGHAFAGASTSLGLLMCAGALSLVNGLFGYALIAADRQRDALTMSGIALALNVALNFALVPAYGIDAAAAITAGCEVVMLISAFVFMRRRFDFFPTPRVLGPALLGAGLMAGALWLARDLPVVLTAPAGAVLYAAVVWVTGGVDRETLRGLRAA
jgi:O-antigen/teichoic acid export membrane protein